MVTAPDTRAVERFQVYPGEARGREEANAVADRTQDIYQDLVHESSPQALTATSAPMIRGSCRCGVQCRGGPLPDVTGEEREPPGRRVRRLVGEDDSAPPS